MTLGLSQVHRQTLDITSFPAPGLKDEGSQTAENTSHGQRPVKSLLWGPTTVITVLKSTLRTLVWTLHTCSIWLTADHHRPDSHSAWPWDCGQHTWTSLEAQSFFDCEMGEAITTSGHGRQQSQMCRQIAGDPVKMWVLTVSLRWVLRSCISGEPARWHDTAIWGPQSE